MAVGNVALELEKVIFNTGKRSKLRSFHGMYANGTRVNSTTVMSEKNEHSFFQLDLLFQFNKGTCFTSRVTHKWLWQQTINAVSTL